MPAVRKPKRLVIRTYQMGFGDCFLLTFEYPADKKRHILIDFGSTRPPPNAPKKLMQRIAKLIAEDCGNKLDAVVATHRHKDHISGFATSTKGDGPGNIIRGLKPDVVIQPWTEDPDAAKKAAGPEKRAATRALRHMNGFAASAHASLRHLKRDAADADVEQIKFIGDDNIANLAAIRNLIHMGRRAGASRHFVQAGDRTKLDKLLPGVKVHILGPPSVADWEDIKKMRSKDEAEFWHLNARAAAFTPEDPGALFPRATRLGDPVNARWFKKRLREVRAETTLAIVRMLDKAMNNTSLILLFEVGNKCILFPGDAQIENWLFALGQKKTRALLKRVTLYKVGHHGSLNATPKSMWKLFGNRGEKKLTSLLSTLDGVHGETKRKTEVPRRTLVDELKKRSKLVSTQGFAADELRRVTPVEFG
jgi:hypothetical protein